MYSEHHRQRVPTLESTAESASRCSSRARHLRSHLIPTVALVIRYRYDGVVERDIPRGRNSKPFAPGRVARPVLLPERAHCWVAFRKRRGRVLDRGSLPARVLDGKCASAWGPRVEGK